MAAALGFSGLVAYGAWDDQTAGLPLVENFSAKDFGSDSIKWIVAQDKLGRLFVGGDRLLVFDGQAWQSFSAPNTYALRALAFGDDGRLWAGAINEVGYFDEEPLGIFKYHSLVQHLPKDDRHFGDVWACSLVGQTIYFFCQDSVLRWDGAAFKVWHFEGRTRLFPLKLDGDFWFHHLETGLYRITDTGPRLEIAAAKLPNVGILGLAKDKHGILLLTGVGFSRPEHPELKVFGDELNQYIVDSKPACFTQLPDGSYAIGTLSGGIAFVSGSGVLLRQLGTKDGLPTRTIFSITPDSAGYAWCATPTGIFRFEIKGNITHFNAQNGLKGQNVDSLQFGVARSYALTREGVFALGSSVRESSRFAQLPQLTGTYTHLLPLDNGLLLSRHGGIDFFDGSSVKPLLNVAAKSVFFAKRSVINPNSIFLSQPFGLAKAILQPDGTFVRAHFLDLPDTCNWLHEDSGGRLWIGTSSKGAYVYDGDSQKLSAINDPASGEPLSGRVSVLDAYRRILLFHDFRVLHAKSDGTGLRVLEGMPPVELVAAQLAPDNESVVIAAKRPNSPASSPNVLGVLTVDTAGRAGWTGLDVPALSTIGFVRTLEFSQENSRVILWVGGSEGLLRLNYDAIPALTKPSSPLIRLDTARTSHAPAAGTLSFPFKDHWIGFRVFAGDYARGKDWLFQYRLSAGRGEWSAAAANRTFEFTNLKEGDFRFEVRAVNSAEMVSEISTFTFTIMPPWYRSLWAYGGYGLSLVLLVLVFIRIRERRIRERNRELEGLVAVRTEELVKANAAKDEFLASVSHEIRNPMNGVIGIAETFKTDSLDADSRYKFGLLRHCASHLSSLLEDILDFSRVQAGAVDLETKPFVVRELVESITAITAADSAKRGIPVEIAISPAVPGHLTGDSRRIRQILLNFVSNALKFSGRGKVCVTVWCKTAGPKVTEVIFGISDEGPGISAEEQKRLFTRFERGAAAQQGRVPGTGLGLALCRGLAEKMGGRIWLESELGHGSCFFFSLPVAAAEAVVPSVPSLIASLADKYRSALVVDDEEYNRIALTELLESLGCTVQIAADGRDALKLAGSHKFDLIFLDYSLPGLNGLEVTRSIRALPGGSANALIFATTAFSTQDKRDQCLESGMNAFLGKPVTMERLQQSLAAATAPANATAPEIDEPDLDDGAPADRVANLRLLANKKRVPFEDELALFLSELEVELEQLYSALEQEESRSAGHYAHLLCGRCGFIYERELESALRKIEAAIGANQWDEARFLGREVRHQTADLRIRLSAEAPVAPPSSAR